MRKHDDCITSNVPFQRAIRHAYETFLTLYSARSFSITTIVSTKFFIEIGVSRHSRDALIIRDREVQECGDVEKLLDPKIHIVIHICKY